MIWILIVLSLITIFLGWLSFKQSEMMKGFSLLLEKFVEVNQDFYESQKNIFKKDKEILDSVVKQTTELSILRKYANQITMALKNVNDTTKNLKEVHKEISSKTEELKTTKEIANSLTIVSNNIKILDKIVIELRKSIEESKRRG